MQRDTDGRDRLSAIQFYGLGLDTPYTDTQVYWLTSGSGAGKSINRSGQPQSGRPNNANSSQAFLYTVERKDRTTYIAAIENGDQDSSSARPSPANRWISP